MTKTLASILLVVLIGACSKQPRPPTGIASWEEVNSLAEAFVLRGKADAVRAHCDVSGVPPEVLQKLTLVLEGWHGVSGDLRHIGTRVMTFTDYEALRRDDQKDLPEDMRNLPSRIKWNVRPEKVIVFTFASNDPKDTATKVRWSAGAYRTNGLWFFAVSYSK